MQTIIAADPKFLFLSSKIESTKLSDKEFLSQRLFLNEINLGGFKSVLFIPPFVPAQRFLIDQLVNIL